MDWKQMWSLWVEATPEFLLVKAAYIILVLAVPVTALFYVFTALLRV